MTHYNKYEILSKNPFVIFNCEFAVNNSLAKLWNKPILPISVKLCFNCNKDVSDFFNSY